MSFAVGSLVRARGREWVVLPESEQEANLLVLRPLGGTEDEVTGIYIGPSTLGQPFEEVRPAEFSLPNPRTDLGNHLSCGLLRDAVRLGFRSGAGPFRSLARIAVEPRPYQLVPLLMALKLDPIRLLIADDVGVGKTIESCLILRELLDRGEVQRFTVLCPPHLAEQWQRALAEQFHIDAALVLAGTAARLERAGTPGQSIFERHPFTVVSTDYIKQERRRHEFLRACPEFVVVDEAHTCADPGARGAAQQRHELLKALARDQSRHLLLVTATPHSGDQQTFRSLLALLDPTLRDLPEDLSGDEHRKDREQLARQFVQRRRGDLTAYMGAETPFPKREIAEDNYSLKLEYRRFFDKVLDYCRETVLDDTIDRRRQRVRWWSALALLRSISSSPAAAAATLRNRSVTVDAETLEAVEEEGRRAVLDLDDNTVEGIDVAPGSGTEAEEESPSRRRLQELAREVEQLAGKGDAKLQRAEELLRKLLDDDYSPIVFCRFIPTVDYVAEALRKKFPKVIVEAISGSLPAEERERRVEELGQHEKRILVCTDCLSEGINLQHHFNAVLHYDLSWNPTRHEQREGRVDRYGQEKEAVRTLTLYGKDNPVDGIVIQVLLRKHKAIHQQLGITVPVPMDTQVVEKAILEGLLLRRATTATQLSFDVMFPERQNMELQWDAAVEREKRSRALFAQHQLQKSVNQELVQELAEVRRALGSDHDVERFAVSVLRALGATVGTQLPHSIDVKECPAAARDAIGQDSTFRAVFRGRVGSDVELLVRTHPVIEGLASYVLETALDGTLGGPGKRCGVIRTRAVSTRTTLLLLRLRFHIVTQDQAGHEHPLLAEDQVLLGFMGTPDSAQWLSPEAAEALLQAEPHTNMAPELATAQLGRLLDRFEVLQPHLREVAGQRGAALLDAHRRVRKAARGGLRTLSVDDHGRADVLGIYVYLPAEMGGAA